MLGDERGDVEVGDDIAVEREERVVDPGELGGETDRSGGVERLGLDGVAQLDAPHRPSGNAARNGSGRNPSASVTVVTSPRSRRRTRRVMIGSLPTVSIDLGTVSVSGRSRVPNPPTRTMACKWLALGGAVGVAVVVSVSWPGALSRSAAASLVPVGSLVAVGRLLAEGRRDRLAGAGGVSRPPSSSRLAADGGISTSTSSGTKAIVIARPFLSNGMSSKLLVYTWLEPGRWSSHTTTVSARPRRRTASRPPRTRSGSPPGGGLPSTVKPALGSTSWCRRARRRSCRRTRRAGRCARSPAIRSGASGSRRRRGCAPRS